MRLFFYGTLLDPDVRAAVIGPRASHVTVTPARLADWRRRRARGKSYPIILQAPGEHVPGVVTSVLDADAVERLTRYEGPGYGLYDCQPVLEDGSAVPARVFQPTERLAADDAEWDLAAWQATEKSKWLSMLRRGVLNV
jgi:hypothetical protein